VAALMQSSLLVSEQTPRDLEEGLLALLAARYQPIARLVPSSEQGARVETQASALADWRNAPSLDPDSEVLWLFERCQVGVGPGCQVPAREPAAELLDGQDRP